MLLSVKGVFKEGVACPIEEIEGHDGQQVVITFLDNELTDEVMKNSIWAQGNAETNTPTDTGSPEDKTTRDRDQVRASRETIRRRLGHAWETIGRWANQHTLAVQAWLASRNPQARRVERQGVTLASTGLQVAFLNLALGSRYPSDIGTAALDAEIAAVKAFFAQRRVGWYWLLSPFCTPPDMGQHLVRHSLVQGTYLLPAMVAPLQPYARVSQGFPTVNPQVHIWQAQTLGDLAAASTIRRIAFRFPPHTALTYFEDMADDWLRGDPARLYLARVGNGPPAAVGAMIMGASSSLREDSDRHAASVRDLRRTGKGELRRTGRTGKGELRRTEKGMLPGVYVMATLPQWERRGLATALLTRILADAAAEGHELIVLTAGYDAYFLYRKFGFEHIFEYAMYYLP
jgi:ribosomal protein S18 acetylase RimI-like enzyme